MASLQRCKDWGLKAAKPLMNISLDLNQFHRATLAIFFGQKPKNSTIHGCEFPFIVHCQSQQVGISYLAMSN